MPTTNENGKSPERATEAFPRWVWLAGGGALLAVGWLFILFVNSFHLTAPVFFVCVGYAAGVAAVYTLFRTGAAAATGDDEDEGSWGRPVGARGELEREKKALLKAIKEAEFDLQMGKLSKADAEAMIGSYRAQAIAVIREIESKDGGDAPVREQIEREVRARVEVAKAKQAAEDRRPQGKKGKKQQAAAESSKKVAETAARAEATAEKAEGAAAKADEVAAKVDEAVAKADAAAEAAAAAVDATAEADATTAEAEQTDLPGEAAAAKISAAQAPAAKTDEKEATS